MGYYVIQCGAKTKLDPELPLCSIILDFFYIQMIFFGIEVGNRNLDKKIEKSFPFARKSMLETDECLHLIL